jgi:hypothetical protein
MFSLREFVNVGVFMSYGASFTAMFRRAPEYVHRIARGAKPADLPIEQPTKFELVINFKGGAGAVVSRWPGRALTRRCLVGLVSRSSNPQVGGSDSAPA